ncbi:MAG: NAD-dependent epimerase/dehydratase family protein [Candidatus Saccharimonadales bacterium]
MKIFIAGASGVIGKDVIPILVKNGHEVAGMTRTPKKAELLESLGAKPIVCNVFDLTPLTNEIESFAPDVIINELTDLPDDPRQIPEYGTRTSRVRIEGTANLIAANKTTKAKLISQSVDWELPGKGAEAIRLLEELTLDISGVVLRYGQIYGVGTYYVDSVPEKPRVSLESAVQATADSLNLQSGIYEVADNSILKKI